MMTTKGYEEQLAEKYFGLTPIEELLNWITEIENSPFVLTASEIELNMLKDFRKKVASLVFREQMMIDQARRGSYKDALDDLLATLSDKNGHQNGHKTTL